MRKNKISSFKKIIFTIIYVCFLFSGAYAVEKNSVPPSEYKKTSFNEQKYFKKFEIKKEELKDKTSPGKINSFWWSFFISFIGGITIWGLGLGPISVLIVYLNSGRDKKELRKSIWGWIIGSILGIITWLLLKQI